MVIVQKCAAPKVCQSDAEREEWGGAGESPLGRIQKGRRQHGKDSRNTLTTWLTAKSSLAVLGWHSTPLRRPHKLSLVKAYRAFHRNKLLQPRTRKQCAHIKIRCSQTWQNPFKTTIGTFVKFILSLQSAMQTKGMLPYKQNPCQNRQY